METSGSDAAFTYFGKTEETDGYCDLEHLPPLLEDEVRQSILPEEVITYSKGNIIFFLFLSVSISVSINISM